MKSETAAPRCEACGEPATRMDAEGIPLCEGDYQHLLEHSRLDDGDYHQYTRSK